MPENKKPPLTEEKDAVGSRKPKFGKMGKEIEDIFSGRKRKKGEDKKPGKLKGNDHGERNNAWMRDKKKRKTDEKKRQGKGESSRTSTQVRKRTDDGLAIYTEEELGMNNIKGGGTSLCPFDCDCCF